MRDDRLLGEVRALRARGLPPKAIARRLGVRPAAIAPLVRRVAPEASAEPVAMAPVVGCWVSPGWGSGLIVERPGRVGRCRSRPRWPAGDGVGARGTRGPQ